MWMFIGLNSMSTDTDFFLKFSATVIGTVGFLWGMYTYGKNRRLQRKESLFPLLKEFDESKLMKLAKEILDDFTIEINNNI